MDEFLEPLDDAETDDEEAAPEQEVLEDKLSENEIETPLKLDYTIKDMEGRVAHVEKIIAATQPKDLTPKYLEILADYIMNAISKEEKRQHLYLTDNRRITIDKRETSLEGLAEKFENGEDGIYNLMTNDKNILLTQKVSITEEDIAEIPGMRELREAIAEVEQMAKAATGRRKYLLKKQLIEMRRDQYVLKSTFKPQMQSASCSRAPNKIDLYENRWVDKNDEPHSDGLVTLFEPTHVAAILHNYIGLKQQTHGHFNDDFYYLMEDFDKVMERALRPYPAYRDLVSMKIHGRSNVEIQDFLARKHNMKHTPEYISALWCKKIPKIIAEQEKSDYLTYYYTHISPSKYKWKRCACCGQQKLAHPRFFSKNSTSSDGYYSWCKDCRNAKNRKKGG